MPHHAEHCDKELIAKTRAKRLKSLREMTGLSRNDFHKRYGIPRGTLQNWESARFGGLTLKGARNIVIAFNAEGIKCDMDWLLHGTGPSPRFTDHTPKVPAPERAEARPLEAGLCITLCKAGPCIKLCNTV